MLDSGDLSGDEEEFNVEEIFYPGSDDELGFEEFEVDSEHEEEEIGYDEYVILTNNYMKIYNPHRLEENLTGPLVDEDER